MKVKKEELDRILNFMVEADRLKEVKRSGWLISNVKNPEHVGDHSYSIALLSYILAKRMNLDANRCMMMALLHDINEVITGDIATRHNKKNQKMQDREKKMAERRNELKMISFLGDTDKRNIRKFLDELYSEKTAEAKLVKQCDKLDYVIQLINYSKHMKSDERVDEFFLTADPKIDIQEVRYLFNKVKTRIYVERKMERSM